MDVESPLICVTAYHPFSCILAGMGFKLYLYDLCVVNFDIVRKQYTISWCVDNSKISHADQSVVTGVIDNLERKVVSMTVTHGNVHLFLGMCTRFNTEEATIRIKDFLRKATRSEAKVSNGQPQPWLARTCLSPTLTQGH